MDDRARFSAAAAAVGAEKTYFSLSLCSPTNFYLFSRAAVANGARILSSAGAHRRRTTSNTGNGGYETTAAFLRFPIGRLRFSILFSLILITNKLMTINLLIILTEWFFSFSFFLTELLARAENATIRLVRDTLKRQRTSYSDSVCPFFR